jgi:hypothetical protein
MLSAKLRAMPPPETNTRISHACAPVEGGVAVMTREVIEQDGFSSAPAFPFTNRRLPVSASPIDVACQFMKLMEPLNYDAALKLVSATVTYTNPPPIGTVQGPAGIRAVLEPFFRQRWRASSGSCAKPASGLWCSWSGSTGTACRTSGLSCR